MGSLAVPPTPMQCGLSLYKDWSGLTTVNLNLLSSQGPKSQHGLCGIFCTNIPTSVLIRFPSPALALALLFLMCSVPNATVLPGRSPGPPGLTMAWGGGFRALLDRGNSNGITTLPYGPSFSPKAGLSSSIMRFVF